MVGVSPPSCGPDGRRCIAARGKDRQHAGAVGSGSRASGLGAGLGPAPMRPRMGAVSRGRPNHSVTKAAPQDQDRDAVRLGRAGVGIIGGELIAWRADRSETCSCTSACNSQATFARRHRAHHSVRGAICGTGGTSPVDFDGDAWLGYTPIRLPDTLVVRDRLPPGAAAALINRNHSYTDLYLPIDARQERLLAAIDGERTIAEICREQGDRCLARAFFQQLWRWDQIVFDTSRVLTQFVSRTD
jgi:hypothetical protein